MQGNDAKRQKVFFFWSVYKKWPGAWDHQHQHVQSGASSRAKHGGAYFSAVRGSMTQSRII